MGRERDGEKLSRLAFPPELVRQRHKGDFDPIDEGARHGLTRELSLAIWMRVSADANDGIGRRDAEEARRRFQERHPSNSKPAARRSRR
jgi:hypothetical protein